MNNDELSFYVEKDGESVRCDIVAMIPGEEDYETYVAFVDHLETMKDIKDNLISRIQRQEKEIKRLNNIIKEAREYLGINEEILETCEIYDVNGIEVYKILQGNKWNEVEIAYLDDKPIGSGK